MAAMFQDLIGMNQGGSLIGQTSSENCYPICQTNYNKCGIFISEDTILIHSLWTDDLILVSDWPENLQMQFNGLYRFC